MNNLLLSNARPLLRAQAVEDFEFFCLNVLGLRVDSSLLLALQEEILGEGNVEPLLAGLSLKAKSEIVSAVQAWMFILERAESCPEGLSQTFEWLFASELREVAA